ncbi:unnamed protein product [Brugia timori]|uniref:Bestrophin homolog n=1 Tax=Brugia timori TaxID=42155 RepID=A0A0R3QDS9_9BILA|nr:unnamed protein product [Brugia timori]
MLNPGIFSCIEWYDSYNAQLLIVLEGIRYCWYARLLQKVKTGSMKFGSSDGKISMRMSHRGPSMSSISRPIRRSRRNVNIATTSTMHPDDMISMDSSGGDTSPPTEAENLPHSFEGTFKQLVSS